MNFTIRDDNDGFHMFLISPQIVGSPVQSVQLLSVIVWFGIVPCCSVGGKLVNLALYSLNTGLLNDSCELQYLPSHVSV